MEVQESLVSSSSAGNRQKGEEVEKLTIVLLLPRLANSLHRNFLTVLRELVIFRALYVLKFYFWLFIWVDNEKLRLAATITNEFRQSRLGKVFRIFHRKTCQIRQFLHNTSVKFTLAQKTASSKHSFK